MLRPCESVRFCVAVAAAQAVREQLGGHPLGGRQRDGAVREVPGRQRLLERHDRQERRDAQGREVAVLAEGILEAGRYTTPIEVVGLNAGIYFVTFRSGGTVLTRRIAVLK